MVILKKQMHIMKKIFGIIFLLSFLCHAQESFSKSADAIVDVADYGLMPDSCQNATEIVHDMLEELSERKFRSLKIVFRKGRYDFYPDETLQKNKETTVLFHISDMKNVTIDGNGSEFIFHGQMKPFRIDSSSEVSLKNFSVDWEVPYNAQCTVKDVTDSYLDLCIDSERYPFEIADGKLYFKGEYGLQQIEKAYANLFDPDTHNLVYRMNDVTLGQGLFDARAECLGDDTVRLHFSPSCRPEKGTVLLFHLARYLANGIEVFDSEDIRIDNVDFYHTLSCGIYAVRTKNVVMKDFNIIANEEKGRVFSTSADATHFIGCTGRIVLDGCTVTGAGDDFINVHGMYAPVTGMAGPKSVRVSPTGRDSGFLPGEKVWIVDTASMQRVMVRKVHASHRLDCTRDYVVEFNDDTGDISGHILENASACPEVLIKNCVMLKKNRARSVLVTTPKKVVIKDNYFNSAGAAVLIEGDIRLWYESGGVRNVLIKNNIFDNCYTSGDNITCYPWGWGEAPISVTPSFQPQGKDDCQYHRNIRILGNEFRMFDYPLLYARSVDGLKFCRNTLERTYDYKPYYRKYNFVFDGCRNVRVRGNEVDENLLGHNMRIMNMDASEIRQGKDTEFNICR